MGRSIYGVTLVVALCGIVHACALAQALAALLGDTSLRYSVALGIYLAALGGCALWRPRGGAAAAWTALARTQWALAAVGCAGPLLLFAWDAGMLRLLSPGGAVHSASTFALGHGLLIALSLLSGFAFPLLLRLAGDENAERVVAAGALGTLAGSAIFPLLLLPRSGLLAAAGLAGALNAACALFVLWKAAPRRRADWLAPLAAAALATTMAAAARPIERAVSNALSALSDR